MALPFVFLMFSVYSSLLMVSPQSLISPDEIFLLAGQSNMAGLGGVVNGTWDGIVPPECSPSSLILRLNANFTWEQAQDPLHRASFPLGVGPGMPFSHWLLQRDPAIGVIGLVPSAVSGTNITQWARGGSYYNQLITSAQNALLGGGGGSIRAVLWYQGESDCSNEEDAMLYKERLIDFIDGVRGDLGSPLMPFIQVALASGGHFLNVVRRAQLETCASLQNVACVDAMGLQLLADNTHLTTPAQVQLGKMLANAYLDTIWLK